MPTVGAGSAPTTDPPARTRPALVEVRRTVTVSDGRDYARDAAKGTGRTVDGESIATDQRDVGDRARCDLPGGRRRVRDEVERREDPRRLDELVHRPGVHVVAPRDGQR